MKRILFIFLLLFISIVGFSQNNFNPKELLKGPRATQQLVNDYSGVLTAEQKQLLENKLDQFNDSTSNQVAVVVIPNLGDYDIADYSVKLGRAWGIGGKQFNNGVILLICTDPNNHKVEIATGYGLEGALPDITCKQIIDNEIVPNFKSNDYYGGIDKGIDAIIEATKGEYKAPEGKQQDGGLSLARIIMLIIVVIVILSIFGRGGGGGGNFLTGMLLGNMLGGGFGGGRGGDGGGGFGGFGGGSFGGGGASGSW